MTFHGIVAPPPTPLDAHGEELDHAGIAAVVEHLVRGGVHGLFVCGTTGEGPLLSLDERERAGEAFAEAAAGRLQVIVHVGETGTRGAVRLARHAASIGADAVAVVAPFFFEHDQAALERHVREVAGATELPTFLYDIPARTSNSYGLELSRRLYAEGVVVGSKDSSGNFARMLDLLDAPGYTLLVGADHLGLALMQAGAAGMVTGPGCVFPEPYARLYDAYRAGDLAGAAHWQRAVVRVSRALGFGGDMPLLRAALGAVTGGIGAPRAPHAATDPQRVARVVGELAGIARSLGLDAAADRFAAAG